MATKDVTTAMVVKAVAEYREASFAQKLADGNCVARLMAISGQPEKVVYSALQRDYNKDLIDYGTSIRCSWLTDKGQSLYDQLSKE